MLRCRRDVRLWTPHAERKRGTTPRRGSRQPTLLGQHLLPDPEGRAQHMFHCSSRKKLRHRLDFILIRQVDRRLARNISVKRVDSKTPITTSCMPPFPAELPTTSARGAKVTARGSASTSNGWWRTTTYGPHSKTGRNSASFLGWPDGQRERAPPTSRPLCCQLLRRRRPRRHACEDKGIGVRPQRSSRSRSCRRKSMWPGSSYAGPQGTGN